MGKTTIVSSLSFWSVLYASFSLNWVNNVVDCGLGHLKRHSPLLTIPHPVVTLLLRAESAVLVHARATTHMRVLLVRRGLEKRVGHHLIVGVLMRLGIDSLPLPRGQLVERQEGGGLLAAHKIMAILLQQGLVVNNFPVRGFDQRVFKLRASVTCGKVVLILTDG